MTDEHKAALAAGRSSGLAVRRYLEALEQSKPRRGRRSNPDSIAARLADVEAQIQVAEPIERLRLIQERKNLQARLTVDSGEDDVAELELVFVEVAAEYGERKGIDYSSWREVGVPADVLRKAGIARGARS